MTPAELIDLAIRAAEAYRRPDLADGLRRSRALTSDVRVVLVGEPNQGRTRLAMALAPMSVVDDPAPGMDADVVLFVSDASEEFTDRELDLLGQVRAACPTVVCVLTKTDLYPAWREVAGLDIASVAKLSDPCGNVEIGGPPEGTPVSATSGGAMSGSARPGSLPPGWSPVVSVAPALIPVSAELRLHAVRTNSSELNDESGFPHLLAFLQSLTGPWLAKRSAAHDVLAVTEQLTADLESSLVSTDQQRGYRWQQILSDGIADLNADIEHDLRERLREVLRVAEAQLDMVDPAKVPEEFGDWLRQQELACTEATFDWMMDRAEWLATQVAEMFDSHTVPEIALTDTVAVKEFESPATEKFGIGQKLIVGMRGGYGGTLMIGMLSTIAGVALINPLSVGAGLLLGGKTVHDERKRMLQRRQAEAKTAVRKHIDDVTFQAGKQCRDLLKEIQRTLRDHFTAEAEQALAAARAAQADQETRARDVHAELERVRNLAKLAQLMYAETECQRADPVVFRMALVS